MCNRQSPFTTGLIYGAILGAVAVQCQSSLTGKQCNTELAPIVARCAVALADACGEVPVDVCDTPESIVVQELCDAEINAACGGAP
jgi:hypothetical protein